MTTRAPRARRRQDVVEHLAADVVEEDVDAVGGVPPQLRRGRRRPCSRSRRRTRARRPASGTCPARRRCRSARQPLIRAIWPATLPTEPAAPETTTVCPGSGPPDVEQAEVRRQPAQAQHAEVHGRGGERGVDPGHAAPVRHRVALHAEDARTPARRPGSPGWRESTTAPMPAARMTSPISDRRDVGAAGVHPRAHRGVDREVARPARGTRRRRARAPAPRRSSSQRAWAGRPGGRPGGTGR